MEAEAKLDAVRSALKAHFLERETLVDGALAALLTKEHVLILGPPGTAKSQLARQVTRHLEGGRYFEWLLTKFSTPEELFGPMSLRALEEGRYERLTTHKLPEAHIAFLDEVFKANSAILNALLTVLNERRFHQGSEARSVPLESLFAASNELPDEEELAALYDRFLLRFSVGYIEQEYKFARTALARGASGGTRGEARAAEPSRPARTRRAYGDARRDPPRCSRSPPSPATGGRRGLRPPIQKGDAGPPRHRGPRRPRPGGGRGPRGARAHSLVGAGRPPEGHRGPRGAFFPGSRKTQRNWCFRPGRSMPTRSARGRTRPVERGRRSRPTPSSATSRRASHR